MTLAWRVSGRAVTQNGNRIDFHQQVGKSQVGDLHLGADREPPRRKEPPAYGDLLGSDPRLAAPAIRRSDETRW